MYFNHCVSIFISTIVWVFFKDSTHFLYDAMQTKILPAYQTATIIYFLRAILKIFDIELWLKLKFDFFGPPGSSHFGYITAAEHTKSWTASLNKCEIRKSGALT